MRAQGAFCEDSAEFNFAGAETTRRLEDRRERFRQAMDALERVWPVEFRCNAFYPLVTWTDEGPRLGASTLLGGRGARDDGRLIALISVACGTPVSLSALPFLRRAEIEFERGRFARSAHQVALARIPAVRGEESARRLYFAAGILDAGFTTPARLMTMCGLDGGEVEALEL